MPEDRLIKLYDGRGNVVSEFNPRFNDVRREIALGYNDNPERRGRAKPISQTGAETWSRQRDRNKIIADAREACEFDWIGGVIERLTLYVCGKIHCTSNTGDPAINDAYDSYYHGWCGDERAEDGSTRCDLSGRHRHVKQAQMGYQGFMVDGDHGFIEIAPEHSAFAQADAQGNYIPGTGEFCLQSVEADCIGSPNEATTGENYISGFLIDERTGRIQSARIFRRTLSGSYVDPQEVPMESFIHLFDASRPSEYRGRSKLVRCLNDLRDIREWVEAEKIAGKIQAQYAVWFTTRDPFNGNGPGAYDGKTAAGTPTQDAVWGKVNRAAEGESISMLAPSARPSGAFMAFIQTLIRKMSVSLGISYGLLWDIAILGGANTRVEIQSDLRKIEYWQQNILVNLLLNRVRNKVIAQGIAMKVLPPSPGWKNCSWNFGRHITADIGHEMSADIEACNQGIVEIESVIAKHTGKSASEIFAANAATANAALMSGTNAGLPVEGFAGGLYPQLTNQKAAFLTPTPIPPPLPGTIEAIGDKGVAKMTEIFIAVGEGKIDRESAVNQLVDIFSIPRSKAEKMVPEEPAEEQLNRAAGLTPEGEHAPVASKPNGSNGSKSKTNGSRK